jgi:hypothetical protein
LVNRKILRIFVKILNPDSMAKKEITSPFTVKQRLAIYKKALVFIRKERRTSKARFGEPFYPHGLCFALALGEITNYERYPADNSDIRSMYPEIYAHRPKGVILTTCGFWWNIRDEGIKRMEVLKAVIAEMTK